MNPEVTIKVSFVREGGEVSISANDTIMGAMEIVPPEATDEAEVAQIPPPPTLEEALPEMDEVMAIPPPSTGCEEETDISPPSPRRQRRTTTRRS